nr:LOW QUALITY PROTEIN: multiple coagulation factor deficiency protein 2 homolog [Dermatophagoides farinae]
MVVAVVILSSDVIMFRSMLLLLLILMFTVAKCHETGNNKKLANDGSNDPNNNILDNVFDWVFGEPDDDHELQHHFGYLRGSNDDKDDLSKLASTLGIKPEFFNFKAHDYDNNDRIDGLELLAMFINERSTGHESNKNNEQWMNLCAKAIDRLLEQEDRNRDGYLDFSEYAQARQRIAQI